MKGHNYIHYCTNCTKEFKAKRPEALYCGEKCRVDAFMKRRRIKNQVARIKTCPSCGLTFEAKRKDALYCCPAHRQRMYRFRSD